MRVERALASLVMAALLAACHHTPPSQSAATAPLVCRVGPDGSPVVADRGIGGTGSPAFADRGIGGTGIIGVITGFGSICLAGQEVSVAADLPVLINARLANPASLRAGQVAVIEAVTGETGLAARRVEVRYEVIGRVERIEADQLQVAGQRIVISPQGWGERPRPGDWIAVSGLREPDGVIAATRLEPIMGGPVMIHGVLEAGDEPGDVHIGDLPIEPTPAMAAMVGRPVMVSGAIVQGRLLSFAVAPDLVIADPGAYFGPSIATVFVEGFATIDGSRLRLGPAFSALAPGRADFGPGRAVFRFERAGSGLRAVDRSTSAPTSATSRFETAPMSNRAIPAPSRPSFDGTSRPEGMSGPPGRPTSAPTLRPGGGEAGPSNRGGRPSR